MTEDDVRSAIKAALRSGARTPEEMAVFIIEWFAPMIHVEILAGAMRVTIARPSGSAH